MSQALHVHQVGWELRRQCDQILIRIVQELIDARVALVGYTARQDACQHVHTVTLQVANEAGGAGERRELGQNLFKCKLGRELVVREVIDVSALPERGASDLHEVCFKRIFLAQDWRQIEGFYISAREGFRSIFRSWK
ncbi:MAG: hypothetical protein ACI841_004923 [Planctomycetota bacterium]|jgi:hypothetical protein